MPEIPYTPEECQAAAQAMEPWFQHDSWTIREGFLLLVGIDPHWSESLVFNDACDALHTEGMPVFSRLGQPPTPEWTPEQFAAGEPPTVTGVVFGLPELMRLNRVMQLWHSHPDHQGMRRAAPSYFLRWAESKNLSPYWLGGAQGCHGGRPLAPGFPAKKGRGDTPPGVVGAADAPLTARAETTYLNIIGAMLALLKSPREGRDSDAAVIAELVENYGDKAGISRSTLLLKFAAAKRSIGDGAP